MDNFFEFKCSYKLFPFSLREYNSLIDNKYDIKTFPHKFSIKENFNYVGSIPDKVYFENDEIYKDYIKNKNIDLYIFNYKKELIKYCINDVMLTLDMINNFLSIIGKEYRNFLYSSYSLSSFSYKIFFKKFNNCMIKPNLSKEDYSYIKASYYGGRCEVFGNPYENELVHYYDFSGMYGQCMLQKFPLCDFKYYSMPEINFYNKIGFHCIEYTSNMDIPVLPVRSNKLTFPNGNNIGTYWYEEIKKFVDKGGVIKKIYNSCVYDEDDYIFKDFVEYFNEIRTKGGLYKKLGKNIINSLYGGFALREEDFFIHITFSEIEAESIRFNFDVIEQDKIGYCFFTKIKKDKKSNKIFNKNENKWSNFKTIRNITYSSIISSKARIKLYNAFEEVQKDGGRILYCDTDSIFASYKNNRINKEIGEIKWLNIYNDAFFVSPKFYGYVENEKKYIKIKGVDLSYIDENFYESAKKMFYSNDKKIKFNNQIVFYNKKFEINIENIDKEVSINEYDKRIFDSTKKTTQAIRNG